MQSSIEYNRDVQHTRINTLLQSHQALQTELNKLETLAVLVETADSYKMLQISNDVHKIGLRIAKRKAVLA